MFLFSPKVYVEHDDDILWWQADWSSYGCLILRMHWPRQQFSSAAHSSFMCYYKRRLK